MLAYNLLPTNTPGSASGFFGVPTYTTGINTYTVVITDYTDPNAPCVVSQTLSVSVNTLTPSYTIAPTTLCSGQTVTLTTDANIAYPSSPLNIDWGDGAGATNYYTQPQTYVYATAGTYTIIATGLAGGCQSTYTQAIQVLPAGTTPTITISPSPQALCLGSCSTFTANGALTYTWSTGVQTQTATLCPTVTTSYYVKGTNACGLTGIKYITIGVYPPQTPITALANPNPICLGASTSLQASGANSYTWTGGSIGAPQGNNIPITPTVTTTYTVIGNNGICANSTQSAVVTVTVNSGSIPAFAITSNNFNVCANGTGTNTVLFSTTLTNTTGLVFTWNPSGIHTPTANIGISQPTVVTVIVANSCSVSQTQSVCVNYVTTGCCTYTNAIGNTTVTTGTYNNQIIRVASNATITITGVADYTNSKLLMGTNSAIIVLPTALLKLENCKLFSCEGMWYGIKTLYDAVNTASVEVRNSTIEDAYKAIDADNALNSLMPAIKVYIGSVFNKNYTDVSIVNTVLHNGNNPLFFESSKMISQSSNTSPGTNLKCSGYYAPTIRDHSYVGLYAENAGVITFTYNQGGAGPNNLVKNKDYGLVFKKTNADVWNTDFKDMIGVPLTFPNVFPLGVAVVSQNAPKYLNVKPIGTSTVTGVTFSNIGYGIIANKTPTVDVQRCSFNNPLQGSNNYGTYGIYTIDANSLLRVNYNTINKTYIGCSANFSVIPTPSTYSMSISNNTITAGTGFNNRSIMVSASVTYPMMLGAMVVAANQITKAGIGIQATNIHNGLRISGNTITLNNVGTHSPFIGIYLAGNNNGLMIDNNNINGNQTGPVGGYDVHCYGIRSDLSPNCFVQCNTITKTAIGIGYIGNNNSPSIGLFNNTLNYPIRRGLYLTNGAVIGTQGSASQQSANQWLNGWSTISNNTDPSQTYVGDGGTVSNSFNSILYVQNNVNELPTDNMYFLPSSNTNRYSTLGSLVTTIQNGTLTCAPTLTAGYRIGVTPTVNITQRNTDYTNYITTVVTPTATALNAQEKWMLKQHMHKTIRQTAVGSNATVANFYTIQQTDNVATYFAVDSLLSVGDTVQAKSKNSSAGTTNAIEQNHKDFNNLYLNGVASASDYATLQTLANLCAYNNGNAVYQARALLDMMNYSHTDYNDSCGAEKVSARLANPSETKGVSIENITAKLYPNPNNGNFTLVYDLKEIPTASIIITDISGQVVYENTVDNMSSILSINTSDLKSGLYFIKLSNKGMLLWTDKVMISK